jgi:hypothetical protein
MIDLTFTPSAKPIKVSISPIEAFLLYTDNIESGDNRIATIQKSRAAESERMKVAKADLKDAVDSIKAPDGLARLIAYSEKYGKQIHLAKPLGRNNSELLKDRSGYDLMDQDCYSCWGWCTDECEGECNSLCKNSYEIGCGLWGLVCAFVMV